MHKSKLVRTLRILTAEEMKQLLPFLQSPFFNTNSNIIKLYRALCRYHPDFGSPKLDKEEVFKKLFPDRPYAHQQLLNLMSEFYFLLEKYLVILQLGKKEMAQEKLLLEAYSERPNCYAIFEKKINWINKKLDGLPFRDDMYFNEKKELSLMYYSHPDTSMQLGDKGALQKAAVYFNVQKKLTDVKLKCALNARGNTIKEKNIENQQLFYENPLIGLYEKLEKFQRSETLEEFNKLSDLFNLTIDLLRTEDKRNILIILLNYSIRQTNSGLSSFHKTTLDLYKIGIEQECLLTYGTMTNNTFQNIVTNAAICQEFDWAKKFIDKYQHSLDVINRGDIVAMSFGLWHFEKKEYQAAITAMQRPFKEPLNIFKSKSLLVRSWFEIWLTNDSYYEFLSTQLEAFEKFNRRDKTLTQNLKTAFVRFIYFTKKIINSNWQKNEIIKIKEEIELEKNLVFKRWLLEKINKK